MVRISTLTTAILCLSFYTVLFVSCSGKASPSKEAEAPAKPDTTAAVNETPPPADTVAESTPAEPAPANPEPQPAPAPSPAPAPAPAPAGGEPSGRTVSENKLTTVLETVAREMEALNLAYISSLGQDCSGIYHQLKDSVQARIPALADKSKYIYPSFREDRSSRHIAHWYYKNNNLHIVQDAFADRNRLHPGCVVFFGRTDEKYTNINIDLLTNPGVFNHDGTKGKIMHVAVVTSVEKDDQGNVTKYTMMHGRNSKHPASRTAGNYDGPGGLKTAYQKFPFGNWNQQLVAIANIETPVK